MSFHQSLRLVDLCSTDETTLMRFSTNRIHEWINQQHTTTCRFRWNPFTFAYK
ncbi:hypothetical protein T08_10382 [Trichinella sp. T8]|nr:hypothetical protein T08_10382 [Trichinella sp. T8]